jgi:hypothetical protein
MTAAWERVLPTPQARRVVGWAAPVAALAFAVLVWPIPPARSHRQRRAGREPGALIALGIALVYRANRVINFAAGDLGQLPATLAVLLVLSWGWNYVPNGHRPRRRDPRRLSRRDAHHPPLLSPA